MPDMLPEPNSVMEVQDETAQIVIGLIFFMWSEEIRGLGVGAVEKRFCQLP